MRLIIKAFFWIIHDDNKCMPSQITKPRGAAQLMQPGGSLNKYPISERLHRESGFRGEEEEKHLINFL